VTEPLSETSASQASTSQGGTTVSVSVPARAIPADVLVVGFIDNLDELVVTAPPPAGADLIAGFAIQARSGDTPVTSDFATPVRIELTLPQSAAPAGASGDELVLAFWNGLEWVTTPATIVVEADGSVTVTADVRHFTAFGLFRQPTPAWIGVKPDAPVSFAIWRGFTGTDPAVAASLATPRGLGIWRLNPVKQRYESWTRTAPSFVNDLQTLAWNDVVFIRTRVSAPTPPRPPSSPPATSAPPTPGVTAPLVHVVTSTDTLSGIGARYGVDWQDIAAANGIVGPSYFIQPGQSLTIPQLGAPAPTSPATATPRATPPAGQARTHVVASTDTLSSIGARYGVDWLDIAAANGIVGPSYFIRSGQVLTIPAASPAPGASTSTGTARTYLVGEGETLSEIGARVGVPWLEIAQANGIPGPSYIVRGGQILIIP